MVKLVVLLVEYRSGSFLLGSSGWCQTQLWQIMAAVIDMGKIFWERTYGACSAIFAFILPSFAICCIYFARFCHILPLSLVIGTLAPLIMTLQLRLSVGTYSEKSSRSQLPESNSHHWVIFGNGETHEFVKWQWTVMWSGILATILKVASS